MHKRIATIALALLLPASTMMVAGQTAGIVYPQSVPGATYPKSGVKVGDKVIQTSSGVFPGDVVETGTMSAMVAFDGLSVQLGPNSALALAAVPELASGTGVFSASKPIALRVLDREVVLSDPSVLKVEYSGDVLFLSVQAGAAIVKEKGTATTLSQGQSISRMVPRNSAEQTASKPTGRQTPSAGATSSLLKRKVFWLGVGGVAAAGVTAGVLATRGEAPVSPSHL